MPCAIAIFDTAVGRCGIAWDETRIRAITLPERDDKATRRRLERFVGPAAREAEPPPFVRAAIDAIDAHLAGDATALDRVPIDLAGVSDFEAAVYAAARRIPLGSVRTYGEIARELGDPQAARAVGAALGRNPWPIVVPCHRVVAANGKLGGFSAPGGRSTKVRLLEIEGARPAGEAPTLFDHAGPA